MQSGENVVPALLRAAALLHKHGAPSAADELLDRLIEDEPQRAPEILDGARPHVRAIQRCTRGRSRCWKRAMMDYPDSVELRYATASVYEEQGLVSEPPA